jgi:cell division protein FtsQ
MAEAARAPAKASARTRLARWVLALGVLGGLVGGGVWGAAWLLLPSNVPFALVRVDGDIKRTKRELLERALTERLTGSFFSLDLAAVREAVESLPWVTRASVRRIWPGTLVVWVQEREALASWGERGAVSPEGEVFWPDPDSLPSGLPRLSGPEGSAPQVVERFRALREQAARHGLELRGLALSDRHAWSLELGGGVRVSLGTRNLDQRLGRVLRYLPQLVEEVGALRVDARYANGFAVLEGAPAKGDPSVGAEG